MANTIQFPTSLTTSIVSGTKNSMTNSDIGSSDFGEMFSTLLASMNSSTEFSDVGGSTSSIMSPLLFLLFTKLFGEIDFNTSSRITPQGVPVNGTITQESHVGHVAVDFGVSVGTAVKATMSGKVTYAGWNNEGYGNLVIVDNGIYETYYAHLSKVPVKLGQTINEGNIIGLTGNTGNSTGPHLHYEIRKNGVQINPLTTLQNN